MRRAQDVDPVDGFGVDHGDAPDYSQAQGTGTVSREIEGGGFNAKVGQALALVKQMPFPARLGIVIWAMVVVLLLSPIGGFLPLVEAANSRIENMAVERGIALAELVGYRNVTAIVDRKNALIDTRFLDGRTGVKFAMVTDSRGVVLSPPDKSGQTMEKEPAYIQAALEGRVAASLKAMTRMAWETMEELGEDTSAYMTEIVTRLREMLPQLGEARVVELISFKNRSVQGEVRSGLSRPSKNRNRTRTPSPHAGNSFLEVMVGDRFVVLGRLRCDPHYMCSDGVARRMRDEYIHKNQI